jgi:adenylate kinase family enzyme
LIIVARIVVIGNAAGGKSTLARHLARRRDLRLVEVNRLFWQHEWQLTSEPTMRAGTLRSLRGDTADQRRRDRCVCQKDSKDGFVPGGSPPPAVSLSSACPDRYPV